MDRYQFLAALHELLRPVVYLEIGVQHGWSLQLSGAPITIGVDPEPRLTVPVPHARVYEMTSAEFFATDTDLAAFADLGAFVDLAFVDGLHHYEVALADFIGAERLAHPGGLIVLDDVLPRAQAMAAREMCPGDWTGDVWKVEPILRHHRPDLRLTLVDTQPTGLLLARDLDPASTRLADRYDVIMAHWPPADDPVPEEVIERQRAVAPEQALANLEAWRA